MTEPLQLCRPLSGAVTGPAGRRTLVPKYASIVPPPFGGGYEHSIPPSGDPQVLLQLCRPLSGAVTSKGEAATQQQMLMLQLCRPLSGAVTS